MDQEILIRIKIALEQIEAAKEIAYDGEFDELGHKLARLAEQAIDAREYLKRN